MTDGRREELEARYAEVRDRFEGVRASWPELLAELRAADFGLRLVEADTVMVLGQWFTASEGAWVADRDRSGPLGENAFGVAWEYRGVHDVPFAFNGLPASGLEVTVRGFTVVGPPTDEARLHALRHYVDWAGLYAQLGLTLNWRLPVPAELDADAAQGG
jgi:hypothetical protein